ncbi:MAG: gephyrin-like molybdotransferase Glp [Gemmatimonadales bacterium]
MLSVAEAVERVLGRAHTLAAERTPLLDALGRVLASPVIAPLTLPPWDNSAMDGYAVRAADIAGASDGQPTVLRVTETVAAGQFPTMAVLPGHATRIMTGAPIPEGADTVVRVEDTDGGLERVTIRDARDSRRNIRPRGEDLRSGDTVLPAGMPIGAAQIGVLASVGAASVDVYRRPRVAYLGSGDELVDLDRFDEALAGRKIVSSNNYTMHALIRAAGGVPVNLGIAPDQRDALREKIEQAAGCDAIVTTAGISVGEFDYIREVLGGLGAEMAFWKVRMRPGAPVGFGHIGIVPWLGLPGNPVSAMVTFELFARPLLRRMQGYTRLHRRPVPVVLEEVVTINAPITHFLRVVVSARDDGTLTARLTGPQGSGILTSMSQANALLVVPEDRPHSRAGDVLHALLLTDDAGTSAHFSL